MAETQTDIFEKLKRTRSLIRPEKGPDNIFFQLRFDENGGYVVVVDKKGEEVQTTHEYYSGPTRDLLRTIESIRERNSFRIDWERPGDHLYIGENDYLLWQLKQAENFVDKKMQPVSFADEPGELRLLVDEEGKKLKSRLSLHHDGDRLTRPVPLNEDHLFCNDRIYRIPPLGENFDLLNHFETTLLPRNLEKFLSLFFSSFGEVPVRYNGYSVQGGEPKKTRPTLIFEKVGPDNSLHLRLSVSLPGFDPDFFDTYEVTRIATLNDMEKKITVSDVRREDIYDAFFEIDKLLKKHRRALKNGASGYFADDNLFIMEEELAKAFIHSELPGLIPQFEILGAEKLKQYKVKAVNPRLDLSLTHGIDFLEGDANLEIEGEKIPLFEALNQYRKNSYIPLSDGTHAIINRSYIDKLNRIFKKTKDKVKVSFFDLPVVEEMIDERIAEKNFKASKEIFMGFNKLARAKAKLPQLNAELRRYQKQGFKWAQYLHKHRLGGCLADDMGLGKTLQAIALLGTIYPGEKKPSLVVMPKSLLFNWENELAKFKPDLTHYTYHGLNRDMEEAKGKNLILTTYAMVRNDIEIFKDMEFHSIILDESQNIKNLNSQISRAVMLLQAEHRLALSGTPIENNLGELYSLFRFLNPSMFGSLEEFTRNYAVPIQKNDDKDALGELKKKIYPFVLRRLKGDVLKDLPEKVEQTLFVDMSEEQRLFYEQRRRFYYETVRAQIGQNGIEKSQFFILQALSELRQIAAIPEAKSENGIISPKREVLMEHINDIVSSNHKVLVFANFLHALDCIGEDLERAGIEYLHMTGATRDRKKLVETFQEEESHRVFLMTLKTGGIGLNLTAADYIFIFDPWWNLAAESQAVDRTHRIGQEKTVFSYKLITKGTIEEKILALQERKRALFDSLISADGASLKSLDEKDVEFVLGA